MILQRWISSWTLGVLSTPPASDGLPACTKRRSRMKTWRNTNTSDTRIGNIDVVYDGLRPPFIDYFRVSGFRTGFPHVVLVYILDTMALLPVLVANYVMIWRSGQMMSDEIRRNG